MKVGYGQSSTQNNGYWYEKAVQVLVVTKTSMGMTSKQRLLCSNKGKSQVKSVHQSCFHEPLHSQEFSKLKRTLQTFVVKKCTPYKLFQSQKADTTNFCSKKTNTLQTFLVSKSGHYKLLQSQKAHTSNFSSLKKWTLQTFLVSKSGHYKLF